MRFFLFLCFSFSTLLASGVENSVIPLMDKLECVENLPVAKYTENQFKEIVEVLECKQEKIRVVTFNMLFPFYDHKLDPVNRWPVRYPRIIEIVKEMKPDVLCVQEVYSEQLKDLLPHLGQEFGFFAKPAGDGEQNGIFYRKDRFEMIRANVWAMAVKGKESDFENLTMVQLRDRKTKKHVAVFNTHFAFGDINKREFQARFTTETIEKVAKCLPVIFTGDLNTFSHRLDLVNLPAYDGDYITRILTSGCLRDAREVAHLGHLGPISTFTNEGSSGVAFRGTGTPGIFLDHIYVTDNVNVIIHGVESGMVDGNFPSDHMPVVVDCVVK